MFQTKVVFSKSTQNQNVRYVKLFLLLLLTYAVKNVSESREHYQSQ
jgi:hypothetical protein